jgi:hypothetical protein
MKDCTSTLGLNTIVDCLYIYIVVAVQFEIFLI